MRLSAALLLFAPALFAADPPRWAWTRKLASDAAAVDAAEGLTAGKARAALKTEKDPFVRAALAAALWKDAGDPAAVDVLRDIIADEKAPHDARVVAAGRLGDIGPNAAPAAEAVLRLPEKAWGRDVAADVLVAMGKRAVPALRDGIRNDSPDERFELACRVIERLGPDASALADDIVRLRGTAGRKQHFADIHAAVTAPRREGLAWSATPRVVEVLFELYDAEDDAARELWYLRLVALRPSASVDASVRRAESVRMLPSQAARLAPALGPDAIPDLVRATKSENRRRRELAEYLLTILGDGAEGPLRATGRPHNRAWPMLVYTGRYEGERLGALRAEYRSGADLEGRCAQAAVLARQEQDRRALEFLRRVLRTGRDGDLVVRDTDPREARRTAARWLGEIGDSASVPDILRLGAADPASARAALLALNAIGPACRDDVLAELRPFAPRAELEFACAALVSLRVPTDVAAGPLFRVASAGRLRLVLDTLGLLPGGVSRGPDSLFAVTFAAEDPDDRYRTLGMLLAGRSGEPELLRKLQSAIVARDPAEEARLFGRAAVVVGPSAMAALVDVATAGPASRRDVAREALAEAARQSGVASQALEALARGEDRGTRLWARAALARLGGGLATAFEPGMMTDIAAADAGRREQAAARLAGLDKAVLDDLSAEERAGVLALLGDEREGVRFQAALAAGKLPAETAVPVLRAALGDGSARVRYAAAYALARHGRAAKDAVPELTKLLRDEDEAVRGRAAAALKAAGAE